MSEFNQHHYLCLQINLLILCVCACVHVHLCVLITYTDIRKVVY